MMNKSSMLFWWPKIKELGIPVPKTEIVLQKDDWWSYLDGKRFSEDDISTLKEAIAKVGYPAFMRTDLASGKHRYLKSSYVDSSSIIESNLFQLIEQNALRDLWFSAIIVREFIYLDYRFTAFDGLPIAPERRYFIKDGKVICHHCCSEDTKLLTENGFKFIKDLTQDERIFTLNPDTKEIELLKPDEYISFHYSGKMVHIKNHNFDTLVTPDHQVPILGEDKSIRLIKANNMRYNFKIPRTGKWIGNGKDEVIIGGTIYPAEGFFEFFGYGLSEGNYQPQGGNNSDRILISQNRWKIKQIIDCIRRLGIDFTVYEMEGQRCVISIHKKEYSELARFFDLGLSYEKYVPSILKEYGPRYLRIFLDAFLYGDGNKRSRQHNFKGINSTSRTYWTSSERLADDIAEIILKVGSRPSINRYHKRSKFRIRGKEYITKHPVITISECNSRPFVAKHPSALSSNNQPFAQTEYDGMVYCVALPRNHIFYIERNGKCTWTGNCYWPEDAIKFYGHSKIWESTNWREQLQELNTESEIEITILTNYAEKVASVLDGAWSVDFAKDKEGKWWLIDMALAKESYHSPCKNTFK